MTTGEYLSREGIFVTTSRGKRSVPRLVVAIEQIQANEKVAVATISPIITEKLENRHSLRPLPRVFNVASRYGNYSSSVGPDIDICVLSPAGVGTHLLWLTWFNSDCIT